LDKGKTIETVAVMGGGAWATACAQVLADSGHNVLLWARNEAVVKDINENNKNSKFHPGVKLSSRITATTSAKDA
jgi:glycerol-3-phosphate dehydrogenase (NAD(P)+)